MKVRFAVEVDNFVEIFSEVNRRIGFKDPTSGCNIKIFFIPFVNADVSIVMLEYMLDAVFNSIKGLVRGNGVCETVKFVV